MAKIIIPTPLRKFTANEASIDTNGETVIAAVEDLARQYPDLNKHLFNEHGSIRQYIRIYVGDEDIEALDQEKTHVGSDAVVSIIPAIAGGKS